MSSEKVIREITINFGQDPPPLSSISNRYRVKSYKPPLFAGHTGFVTLLEVTNIFFPRFGTMNNTYANDDTTRRYLTDLERLKIIEKKQQQPIVIPDVNDPMNGSTTQIFQGQQAPPGYIWVNGKLVPGGGSGTGTIGASTLGASTTKTNSTNLDNILIVLLQENIENARLRQQQLLKQQQRLEEPVNPKEIQKRIVEGEKLKQKIQQLLQEIEGQTQQAQELIKRGQGHLIGQQLVELRQQLQQQILTIQGMKQQLEHYKEILSKGESIHDYFERFYFIINDLGYVISNKHQYDYGLCPICLVLIGEETKGACLYHHHVCPRGPPAEYNQFLFDKYFTNNPKIEKQPGDINTTFCITCGRACFGHQHFQLTNTNFHPSLLNSGNLWICQRQFGGGERRELIARILGIIDAINNYDGVFKKDQNFITFCTNVAERAAMDPTMLADADTCLSLQPRRLIREIRRDIRFFPDLEAINSIKNNQNINNGKEHFPVEIVEYPNNNGSCWYCREILMEDKGHQRLYRFHHRNHNGADYRHPDTQLICYDDIITHIQFIMDNGKSPECFISKENGCGGIIHPREIELVLAGEKILERYKLYYRRWRKQGLKGGYPKKSAHNFKHSRKHSKKLRSKRQTYSSKRK